MIEIDMSHIIPEEVPEFKVGDVITPDFSGDLEFERFGKYLGERMVIERIAEYLFCSNYIYYAVDSNSVLWDSKHVKRYRPFDFGLKDEDFEI